MSDPKIDEPGKATPQPTPRAEGRVEIVGRVGRHVSVGARQLALQAVLDLISGDLAASQIIVGASGKEQPELPRGVGAEIMPLATLRLAHEILDHPQEWLNAVNSQFGDRKPIDLIGTEEEAKVYNLLSAVDQGLF